MRREIKIAFLYLLGGMILAACSDNEYDLIDGSGETKITASVNSVALDAFTSKASYNATAPSLTAPLRARVLVSKTSGVYVEDDLYANGTMIFTGTDKTVFDTKGFSGVNYYKNNDPLYFVAMHPDSGWVFAPEPALSGKTMTYTFTGKEDVMFAMEKQSSASQSVNKPSFDFNHLLTKLTIKLVAENENTKKAWGKITDIELINANNEVTVLLDEADLETAAPVSSAYNGSTSTTLSAHLISDDTPIKDYSTGIELPLASTNPNPLAYVLAAPVMASSDAEAHEYTLRIKTAAGYVQQVPLDLKSLESGAFSGNTQGCSFDVTLTFKAHKIAVENNLTLKNWSVSILIQPVPLGQSKIVNHERIKSAIKSLGYLNDDDSDSLIQNCKYFALYIKNDVAHDILIDMNDYDDLFTKDEQVMFDAKKIVGEWKVDTTSHVNAKFEVQFNPDVWKLGASAQPIDTLTVDGLSYATTQNPSNIIQNKGSIILVRK